MAPYIRIIRVSESNLYNRAKLTDAFIQQISTASSNASDTAEEQKEKHCVRCHSTYSDPEDKCRVPHVFKEAALYLSQGKFSYGSECCGEVITVTQRTPESKIFDMDPLADRPDSWFCFDGKHTTFPADVHYNGVNIFRCRHHPDGFCTRSVLEGASCVPVFKSSVKSVESDLLDRKARGEWLPPKD